MKKLLLSLNAILLLTLLTFTAYTQPNNGKPPGPNVPDELVGNWANGSFDFKFWENYKEGYYMSRNATIVREAMVFKKNEEARYYRYYNGWPSHEKLVDCIGTVTFNNDGTFSFQATKGRKRVYGKNAKNEDRPLTAKELDDPEISGKRKFELTSDPATIRITVPGSAPYNWYKLSQ